MSETRLTKRWWIRLAAILAVLQIVFAVGIGLDSEATVTERVVIFSAWAAGGALVLLGIRQRTQQQRRGDALIALGVIPSVVTGIIAFWFPPMWLVGAGGLLVIWQSIRDAMATKPASYAAAA